MLFVGLCLDIEHLRWSNDAGLYQVAAGKHTMASLTDDHVASCPMDSTQPLKPFSEMPGPKGLPYIGTLWEYMKRNGLKFNKMFQVRILYGDVTLACFQSCLQYYFFVVS